MTFLMKIAMKLKYLQSKIENESGHQTNPRIVVVFYLFLASTRA